MSKTKYRATPAARALIKQNKLDISLIKGTGPKGRIQKDDVLYFDKEKIVKISPLARKISGIEGVDISAIVGTGINGKIMKDDIISYINLNEKDVNYENTYEETSDIKDEQISNQEIEEIPMSMMRRTVAKRMSESYFTAPTFIANIDVDMTETKALREKLLESIMEETGYKLTVTDIVSLAAVKSLLKHPYINSSLSHGAGGGNPAGAAGGHRRAIHVCGPAGEPANRVSHPGHPAAVLGGVAAAASAAAGLRQVHRPAGEGPPAAEPGQRVHGLRLEAHPHHPAKPGAGR